MCVSCLKAPLLHHPPLRFNFFLDLSCTVSKCASSTNFSTNLLVTLVFWSLSEQLLSSPKDKGPCLSDNVYQLHNCSQLLYIIIIYYL